MFLFFIEREKKPQHELYTIEILSLGTVSLVNQRTHKNVVATSILAPS